MKKAIPVFLFAFLLLLGAFAAAEEAERETHFSGEYTYVLLEDGTAEILLYGADETDPLSREAKNLVIPSVLDGHPVTRIGDRAFWLAADSFPSPSPTVSWKSASTPLSPALI